MAPEEALEEAQRLYRAGHYEVWDHAWRQMRSRNATPRDLRNAILDAASCRAGHSGRWLIEGRDLEGDSLTVVVELRTNLQIVTVRE
jgi:hypothetical protein